MVLIFKRVAALSVFVASLLSCVAYSATVTLDPVRVGITSRGGINQGRSSVFAGIWDNYGDVFVIHYVYDLSSLFGQSIQVNSASILFSGGTLRSLQDETLSVGNYVGSMTVLMTDNFERPTYITDRTIYPNLMQTVYGSAALSHASTTVTPFGISLNSLGLNDVANSANDASSNLVAFGVSLGIPNYILDTNRLFTTGSAQLQIDYEATAVNVMPTANAGEDQSIRAGDTVFLDGSSSFDDNTAAVDLGYQWSITGKPVGSAATLDDPSSDMPSFVADLVGTYDIELIVTDEDEASSSADPVQIGTSNLAPTSVAGMDQLVFIGDVVFLDGSGSTDPEPDPLTFAWAITSAPGGSIAALNGAGTASPDFLPDVEGLYVVELTASDFIGPGAPDSVKIMATAAEEFAEIQVVNANEEIALIPPADVTTEGNQTAFTNFLQQAMTAILEDDIATAIDKLEKSILRTDGCALRGSPDLNGKGRDWITDCAAQTEVYDLLTSALDALTP